MELGIIGLGRMGANMVRRLLKGHLEKQAARPIAKSRRQL